jgi:cell division protein FtsI (penicillin-binding protein 3)
MSGRPGDIRGRIVAFLVIASLVLVAVIVRVVWLQTVGSAELLAAGRAQTTSDQIVRADRGSIFAADGSELALSVPSKTVIANPKLVVDPTGEVSVLGSLLGLSPAKQQSLVDSFAAKSKVFVYVARQVPDKTAASVTALNLPGIDVITESRRVMPSGSVGRSLLGRTDVDGKGTAGLELQYNALLTGTDGEMIRQHDSRGRSIPGSDATSRAPVPGQDLVLTVNRSLQFEVEQALVARLQKVKGAGGSVVVMDSHTGEIYAAANALRDVKDPTKVSITNANLAAVDAFEPGSVAKVFSLAATIDSGVANPDTEIDVPGALVFDQGTKWQSTISDAEVHGTEKMTMRRIMVHSSNIGTYLLSQRITSETLFNYFTAFGFGKKTSLDFPGETTGNVPDPSQWKGTEAVTVTYGYHYQASAFQFAAAVNVVANGGLYVAPRLLKSMIGANGAIQDADPSATHRVLKDTTAAQMVSMMKDVVCQGTGQGAQLPGISVAGKTGTAYKVQKGKGYGSAGDRQYRASFVGFFPADAPRVTILVTIDQPDPTSQDRFGGKAAAPLFATIANDAIHELKITPVPGDKGCPAAHG